MRRGAIGVRAQTITPALAKGLGLPRPWGTVLSDVYPGSPAAAAGLQPGDLILTMNGKVMENGRQFTVNMYRQPIGQRVRLQLVRDGSEDEVQVQVTERRDDPARFVDLVVPERNLIPELGILCLGVDERIAPMLAEARREPRVVVAARAPGAPFWEGGLLPGDILYQLNGLPIVDLVGFKARIAALRTGDVAVLHLQRDLDLIYVVYEL